MEPQINITCRCQSRNRCCRLIVLAILIAIFTFTVGLLIGAALSRVILSALAAIIVFAIIIFILILIKIIMIRCERKC